MTAPLALEGEGSNWRLALHGDWRLAQLAGIQDQLKALPATLTGTLICDWRGAEAPGSAPAGLYSHVSPSSAMPWPSVTTVSPTSSSSCKSCRPRGSPRQALRSRAPKNSSSWSRTLASGPSGPAPARATRWFFLAASWRSSVRPSRGCGHCAPHRCSVMSTRPDHRHTDRGADRIPDQRDRCLSRGAAAEPLRRRYLRGRPRDDRGPAGTGRAADGRHRGGPFRQRIRGGDRRDAAQRGDRRVACDGHEPDRVAGGAARSRAGDRVAAADRDRRCDGLAGGGLLSLLELHISLPQYTERLRDALAPTTFGPA